jgi:4-amino-4-deoxy-L-arabinose transferase-like glycosyltransferase
VTSRQSRNTAWRKWGTQVLGDRVAIVALLALLFLISANYWLNRQQLTPPVVVILLLGLGLWLLLIWNGYGLVAQRPMTLASDPLPRRGQWLLVAATLPMAGIAWVQAAGNTFRPLGTAMWLLAIVTWLVAWWPRPLRRSSATDEGPAETDDSLPDEGGSNAWGQVALVLALLAVLLLGAFFRFYDLDGTPLDPTSDHSEKLFDVHDVLEGQRPIFFERNTGREPGQFYLTAGLIEAFDLPFSYTTLKFGAALIGFLAIPFVYLLAAELMGRFTGILAATLYAMGSWTVGTARAGLRFPYAPLMTAATLWLLVRWLRTGDRRDALLCGLALGIGLHGYTPFRVMGAVVLISLLIAFFDPAWRGDRQRVVRHGLLIAATAGLVFLPLGRYAVDRPEMFWHRTTSSIGAEGGDRFIDEGMIFVSNNVNATLAFNWRGDGGFVNAVTHAPFLDVVSGGLLLAGVISLIATILLRCDRRLLLLALAVPVLFLASTLVIEVPHENPSVNRAGGAAPIIYVTAALPLAFTARWLTGSLRRPWGWRIAGALLVLLLSVAAIRNYEHYFGDFDRQYRAIVANTTAIADTIEEAGVVGVSPEDAYIIDTPFWLDVRNVAIALGDAGWAAEHNVVVDAPLPEQPPDRPLFFIINQKDEARLAKIQQTYPDGVLTLVETGVPSKDFYTYWVRPPVR